jgi:hypothetical protein
MVAERPLRAAVGDDVGAGAGAAFFGEPAAAFDGGGLAAGLGDGLAAVLVGDGERCTGACTGLGLNAAGDLLPGLLLALLLAPTLLLELALLLVAAATGFAAPACGGGCDVADACLAEVPALGATAAHGNAKVPTEHPEEFDDIIGRCIRLFEVVM